MFCKVRIDIMQRQNIMFRVSDFLTYLDLVKLLYVRYSSTYLLFSPRSSARGRRAQFRGGTA